MGMDAIECIKRSMEQTTDCQDMVKELLVYCELLIEKVKELEVENERLKGVEKEKC